MKETEHSIVPPLEHEVTLRESLVGPKGKLSKELTSVARMINYLDLNIFEKRQVFFYHLWQESFSLSAIKQFIEVKEDSTDFILTPVLNNDRLVSAYSEFHDRFELKNKARSKYQERAAEILPLHGVYPIAEISLKTGYSEDYIKSVFKRAIKKGILYPLDKKVIAKYNPRYKYYLQVREEVRNLRTTTKHNYSVQEIANILSDQFEQPISTQMVKRQIRMLLAKGEILRR